MTTYQVTATMEIDAENEDDAVQTFVEALADSSIDPTITVLSTEVYRNYEPPAEPS